MTPELNLTFLDHQKWDTSKKFVFFFGDWSNILAKNDVKSCIDYFSVDLGYLLIYKF